MRKLLTVFTVTTLLLIVSTGNWAESLQTYGPTTASDHLWHIAQAVRPSREVSKQQTMVAILKANPQAFISNNVNGLRSGYILTIPTAEQIKAIPSLSALIQISAQNSAWLNKLDFDPSTVNRGSKAPPFGTVRGAKQYAEREVYTTFSAPTEKDSAPVPTSNSVAINSAAPVATSQTEQGSSVSQDVSNHSSAQTINQPIAQAVVASQGTINHATLQGNTRAQQIIHNLPTLGTSLEALSLFPTSFETAAHLIDSTMPATSAVSSSLMPTQFITATSADALIKNGIATHISNLSQKLDDFLIKFNQLDQQTKQRLDVIADEHVAMKNQIASLDKQMQQLRDNYLQYSTPILHRSAFADYGIWIMGSSVLACLLVLIMTLSRRRRVQVTVNTSARTQSSTTVTEDIDAIEDEYDYLGSREGIAAKLDLARAYIDMGDTSQASIVLNEVITHGNEEQRYTARKILSDITLDTVH